MEKSSFFNAQLVGEEYDRVYLAEDYAKYFSTFIGNGIFPNPSTNCQVLANTDNMYIKLSSGLAWINGYMYWNTDVLNILIAPADGVLNRIDRVVLRLDFVNREIKCYVKEGDFASSPVAKGLTRNADMYELGIADIYVTKGAVKITQANVTDLRLDSNYCGLVHGVVDQVNVSTIFNQYNTKFTEAETGFETTISNAITQFTTDFNTWFTTNTTDWSTDFTDWFNNVKATLSGDIAANLQSQIDAINTALGGKSDTNHTHNYAGSSTPGGAAATSLACTGNSATATKLATARTINGINFDGSTNINNYASTSGTSTAYTCTITGASYVNGLEITILPHVDCGANATLNVNSLGALTIKNSDGETLKAGDIKAGVPVSLVRVGSYFFIRGGGKNTDKYGTKLNLFVQTSEPTTKNGIWVNSSTAKVEDIIHSSQVQNTGETVSVPWNLAVADAVVVNNSIYILNSTGFYRYDIATTTITTLSTVCSIGTVTNYGKIVYYSGNIYAFYGSSTVAAGSDYILVYSINSNSWSEGIKTPIIFTDRGSVVVVGSYAYIYMNSTTTYKLDMNLTSFTSLTQMPYPYLRQALYYNNKIYLIGVSSYSTGTGKSTYYDYIYNIATDTYTYINYNGGVSNNTSDTPYIRSSLAGDKIYMRDTRGCFMMLDTISNTYTQLATSIYTGVWVTVGTSVYILNTTSYKYSVTTVKNLNTIVIYNVTNVKNIKMIDALTFFDTLYKIGNGTYITDANGDKITCSIYAGNGTTWNLLS